MSELPVYPMTDYDRGVQLLTKLGSFWVNIFEDRGVVQTHMHSDAQGFAQTYLNTLETTASISRLTIPIFHTENWFLLVLKKSETENIPAVYAPGDLVYGPQTGDVKDRPAGLVQKYGQQDKVGVRQARLPAPLVNCPFQMQNLVLFPSRVLVAGLDYSVDQTRGLITFAKDPFEDTLFPRREVFNEVGAIVDEEIAIWVYRGQFDYESVFKYFGYAVGMRFKSSQDYRELLNAYWDMLVLGGSLRGVTQYLAALSGTPTIVDPKETLVTVIVSPSGKTVVTDTRVYHFPLNSTLTVSNSDIGTVYSAGDTLCDAFQIEELSRFEPNWDILPAVTLGRNFLSGQYFSELTFRNSSVNLEYLGLDADNKAVVRFEVSGYPGDVELFWDMAQELGKQSGNKTLAELLDTRTNPVDQPGPLALPPTVNPMVFVLKNLMRNNLFVIRIRQSSFDRNVPGASAFSFLRDVVPPHTTYIVFVDTSVGVEVVNLALAGDEENAGAEEEVGKFKSAGPLLEQAYEVLDSPGNTLSYGTVAVSAKHVSLTCA